MSLSHASQRLSSNHFKNYIQEFPAFRSYLPKYYEGQNWIFEVLEVQKSQ
jgi:hypothetical protein